MSANELEDLDLEISEEDIPDADEAGPSAAGRTPVLGTIRRKNGLPVARDEIPDLTEEL